MDSNIPVAKLLRMAKAIATKLSLDDALVWIDRELDGYMHLDLNDLPNYRRITGEPKYWNPFHGWQTIVFDDPGLARACSQAPLGESLPAMEQDLLKGGDSQRGFPYTPETRAQLVNALGGRTDVLVFLSNNSLWGVLEAVRNLILNWSLQLEKKGVLGEGMAFSEDDKKTAASVTNQIFGPVGVLGNVQDHAAVAINQDVALVLDAARIRDFTAQAEQALPLLPSDTRNELTPVLKEITTEADRPKPDQSKLRSLLGSARKICEGATGSLIAQGVVALIKSMM